MTTILIHVGTRPTYELQVLDFKRKLYIEEFPDGGYRIWNKRMLKSGCNKTIDNDPEEMRGCLYCPWCDEWFNREQWSELGEDRGVSEEKRER